MANKVEKIFKEAKSTERNLNSLLEKEYKKSVENNMKKGLGEYQTFASWTKYETDDMFDNPRKIKDGDLFVWKSNVWVGGNKVPEGVEIKDGRFPVECVSLWYTPHCYMKMGMNVNELYKKSETEKILYEDFDIKISMVRRNVIPFFRSTHYGHRFSKHEYVLYLKLRKNNNKAVERKMQELLDEIKKLPFGCEERKNLSWKRAKLGHKLFYWHECFSAPNLKDLERKALYYFNDWYDL